MAKIDEDGMSDDKTLQSESKTLRRCAFVKSLRKHVAVVSICALILVIILLIVTIIILLQRDQSRVTVNIVSEETNLSAPLCPNTDQKSTTPSTDKANSTLPDKFRLVTRMGWLAEPPVEPADPLATPVPYVIIHHTQTENCSSEAACIFQVRSIQTFHMASRNWWDIGYNFLVGGVGDAYEGRGWTSAGAHTYGYNGKSLGIAFIGTFNLTKPPPRQIGVCKRLIAKGLELGYISKDYKLLAARQLQTTESPGAALYEDMKTWGHWSQQP